MKLGYIHSNREEQTRVMQVLKMTSESVALDELGIGRIRDAFADRMFPGIYVSRDIYPAKAHEIFLAYAATLS